MQGTVKFFHDQKNYGFIETEEMDDDVFFHKDDQDDDIDVEEGDRGPKAVNVTEV